MDLDTETVLDHQLKQLVCIPLKLFSRVDIAEELGPRDLNTL